MLRIFFGGISGLFLMALFSQEALAIESIQVLPESINSLSVKTGTINGLNQFYSSGGRLQYLSNINSFEFNAETLISIQPNVAQLVNLLNQFGQFSVGDNVHLGQLKIKANPEVSYFAPLYLKAINRRWTLGLAAPLIFYKNTISIEHRGSNIGQLREQFGGLSSELDEAFDQLDVNMRAEVNEFIEERGYEPLSDRDESFLGDLQLISLYQFNETRRGGWALRSIVTLPTGPKDDPHSLTDLEVFHRTSIENKLIHQRPIYKKLSLLAALGHTYYFKDKTDKRVPIDGNDLLPERSQTESVSRKIGNAWSIMMGGLYNFSDSFSVATALDHESKAGDSYNGSRNLDYKLLEKNSHSEATAVKLDVGYSGVQDYYNKKAIIPYSLSYELSSVIAGVNVENQTSHEIWLKVFF